MPIPEISPSELKAALSGPPEKRPVLLDVRRPEEHELVTLPGAVLIPLHELEARVGEVPKSAGDVIVYCHHGVRSLKGAAILVAHGIGARSLAGGIDAWAAEIDPSLPRY